MKVVSGYTMIYVLSGFALLFIVAPLFNMFMSTPLDALFIVTRDNEVTNSIFLTIWVSLAATIFLAVFSIPFAYIISRSSKKIRSLLTGIASIPIIIPHSAAGIAILGLVSRDSSLGQLASAVGLSFIDNPLGIAFAMAYVSVPFLIITAIHGFSDVPAKLEMAAQSMGASKFRVFLSVSLPLAKKQIIAGMVLMFSRGISEFGAVIMVAYFPKITPILIYDRFTSLGLSNARPIAIIYILICLMIFFLFWLYSNKKGTDA
jgi:molybdate/tungstate transport system permease protein